MTDSLDNNKTESNRNADQPERSVGDLSTMRAERQRKRFKRGELILGRYKITGELGQGGMGVVFRCFDEVGGIDVALKALPPELAHNSVEMDEVRENFQLVQGLAHPNIAQIKTLEKDPDTGDVYLVMECVDGVNLRRWRKQGIDGKRSLDQILPILSQAAEAMDYAHSQGIIHRDIKPSNIMIKPDGTVKLLDFGLAAQIHTSLSRVSQVQYGTSGTGPYMAPEQWRGRRQDQRTDLYALAAMTYELLAGHPPFQGHDPSVLRQAVLNESPEPIEDLDTATNHIIQSALDKDPKNRFPSCKEFVERLKTATARPSPRKDKKRNGRKLFGWLLLIIALVVGGWLGWLDLQNEPSKSTSGQTSINFDYDNASSMQPPVSAEYRKKGTSRWVPITNQHLRVDPGEYVFKWQRKDYETIQSRRVLSNNTVTLDIPSKWKPKPPLLALQNATKALESKDFEKFRSAMDSENVKGILKYPKHLQEWRSLRNHLSTMSDNETSSGSADDNLIESVNIVGDRDFLAQEDLINPLKESFLSTEWDRDKANKTLIKIENQMKAKGYALADLRPLPYNEGVLELDFDIGYIGNVIIEDLPSNNNGKEKAKRMLMSKCNATSIMAGKPFNKKNIEKAINSLNHDLIHLGLTVQTDMKIREEVEGERIRRMKDITFRIEELGPGRDSSLSKGERDLLKRLQTFEQFFDQSSWLFTKRGKHKIRTFCSFLRVDTGNDLGRMNQYMNLLKTCDHQRNKAEKEIKNSLNGQLAGKSLQKLSANPQVKESISQLQEFWKGTFLLCRRVRAIGLRIFFRYYRDYSESYSDEDKKAVEQVTTKIERLISDLKRIEPLNGDIEEWIQTDALNKMRQLIDLCCELQKSIESKEDEENGSGMVSETDESRLNKGNDSNSATKEMERKIERSASAVIDYGNLTQLQQSRFNTILSIQLDIIASKKEIFKLEQGGLGPNHPKMVKATKHLRNLEEKYRLLSKDIPHSIDLRSKSDELSQRVVNLLSDLESELADLQIKERQLDPSYGKNHPDLIATHSEIGNTAELLRSVRLLFPVWHSEHAINKFEHYDVKSGDVLSRIATRHNTTVQKILYLNNLDSTKILVGQRLLIPSD